MRKVHVTQDEFGFWFISMEEPDGTMKLIAHHYVASGPAIEDAQDLIRQELRRAGPSLEAVGGAAPGITMVVDSPRKAAPESLSEAPVDYRIPEPRKAGQ